SGTKLAMICTSCESVSWHESVPAHAPPRLACASQAIATGTATGEEHCHYAQQREPVAFHWHSWSPPPGQTCECAGALATCEHTSTRFSRIAPKNRGAPSATRSRRTAALPLRTTTQRAAVA